MTQFSFAFILPLAFALPLAVQAQDGPGNTLGPDLQQLVSNFRDAGCTMPARDLRMFLRQGGFDDDEYADLLMNTAALDGLIEADFSGDTPTFALAPALCDPQGADDMRATLTLALRMNGCAMSEPEADALFGTMGLTGADTGATAIAMIDAGELSVAEDGSATLSAAMCEGAEGAVASPRGAIYAQMRSTGCMLDRDGAGTLMEHPLFAGIPDDGLGEMLYMLREMDLVDRDGDELLLHPDICAAT